VYLFTRRKWGNSFGAALRPLDNYPYRPAEPVQTDRRLNADLSPLDYRMRARNVLKSEAGVANHRNGSSAKTVLTPEGALELSIPRDRHGRFDPALIGKYRRRGDGCARSEELGGHRKADAAATSY
jgi:hypothetical protein